MDYAMKSLSLLTPTGLSKAVTSSVSVSTSMAHQLFSHVPRPKPFRVTNADRSVKKGMMADGLLDLLNKVSESLSSDGIVVLVLEEDGTGVDSEEFFQTLPENTVLMFLEKGQKWAPCSTSPSTNLLCRQQSRTDVAKLTFDLYKNNPKDFIGCLSVKATLYGAYSVSYDLRCYAAKRVLKEALRWTLFSMQATGHILLGSSCYIEQLLEEEERAQKSLALPQESRIRQLQGMLLGKTSLL
ncbi:Cell death activator CIDE-3 [Oryzias melastigma]|uniref:Cell death activator CIDE-3 n=1 Tax=Oryzias melastigma TaxID=30732 RepID=A0A834FL64_ORYME|nr:cell death activator CIDE-3 [Oryzias melastigma]XP_024149703.1 cell death activator CIDE-3 [Oryzias melastigma]XP_024149704.1 cell death activator CIDE-3 [Oryzias melastigma]KAF6736246.1 Cell death activator CIDE-3 [Oryzias melastigma]